MTIRSAGSSAAANTCHYLNGYWANIALIIKKITMRKTSLEAYHSLPDQKTVYSKIIKAMKRMKGNQGNFQQIAKVAGLYPDQVWKRLSELERMKIVENTGETSLTSSGRKAMVRRLNKKLVA